MKEEIKKYIKSVIKNAGVATFLTINFDNILEAKALCNTAIQVMIKLEIILFCILQQVIFPQKLNKY